MIQGLGIKHQPLLPHTSEAAEHEADEMERGIDKRPGGSSKIEDRVGGVGPAPMNFGSNEDARADTTSEREGHFDRPLKEIRVGESPSRPWGISIPVEATTQEKGVLSERTRPEPKPKSTKAEPSDTNLATLEDFGIGSTKHSKSNVVFHGPVFIGYPPQEAAAFLKQIGARQRSLNDSIQ